MTHGSCNFAPPNDLEYVKDLLETRRKRRELEREEMNGETENGTRLTRSASLGSAPAMPRLVRSQKDDNFGRNLHQCPGYLREEITLRCDLSKSTIVSHAFPDPNERCLICHQRGVCQLILLLLISCLMGTFRFKLRSLQSLRSY